MGLDKLLTAKPNSLQTHNITIQRVRRSPARTRDKESSLHIHVWFNCETKTELTYFLFSILSDLSLLLTQSWSCLDLLLSFLLDDPSLTLYLCVHVCTYILTYSVNHWPHGSYWFTLGSLSIVVTSVHIDNSTHIVMCCTWLALSSVTPLIFYCSTLG